MKQYAASFYVCFCVYVGLKRKIPSPAVSCIAAASPAEHMVHIYRVEQLKCVKIFVCYSLKVKLAYPKTVKRLFCFNCDHLNESMYQRSF